MSLNWDLTKCWKLTDVDRETQWPVIQVVIVATMAVGLGEITEKNLAEWDLRLRALDLVADSGFGSADVLSILPKLVGLRTNVFPAVTRAGFIKLLGERAIRAAEARRFIDQRYDLHIGPVAATGKIPEGDSCPFPGCALRQDHNGPCISRTGHVGGEN